MYNFYIFVIIIVLIKPINKFLLKNIFETLTVIEVALITPFIVFVALLLLFFVFLFHLELFFFLL